MVIIDVIIAMFGIMTIEGYDGFSRGSGRCLDSNGGWINLIGVNGIIIPRLVDRMMLEVVVVGHFEDHLHIVG